MTHANHGDDATLVKMSCLDDDAQGKPLSAPWEKEKLEDRQARGQMQGEPASSSLDSAARRGEASGTAPRIDL